MKIVAFLLFFLTSMSCLSNADGRGRRRARGEGGVVANAMPDLNVDDLLIIPDPVFTTWSFPNPFDMPRSVSIDAAVFIGVLVLSLAYLRVRQIPITETAMRLAMANGISAEYLLRGAMPHLLDVATSYLYFSPSFELVLVEGFAEEGWEQVRLAFERAMIPIDRFHAVRHYFEDFLVARYASTAPFPEFEHIENIWVGPANMAGGTVNAYADDASVERGNPRA